jgi:hypothetical protein
MVSGDIETNELICPCCQRRSARSKGGHQVETVLVDYRPLDDELVGGVIHCLTRLAERARNASSKQALSGRSVSCIDGAAPRAASPLWDSELDGKSNPTDCLERDLVS